MQFSNRSLSRLSGQQPRGGPAEDGEWAEPTRTTSRRSLTLQGGAEMARSEVGAIGIGIVPRVNSRPSQNSAEERLQKFPQRQLSKLSLGSTEERLQKFSPRQHSKASCGSTEAFAQERAPVSSGPPRAGRLEVGALAGGQAIMHKLVAMDRKIDLICEAMQQGRSLNPPAAQEKHEAGGELLALPAESLQPEQPAQEAFGRMKIPEVKLAAVEADKAVEDAAEVDDDDDMEHDTSACSSAKGEKTRNIAFEDVESECSAETDEMEDEDAARQVEELHRWFERLCEPKVEVLSAEQVFSIMKASLGNECALDLAGVRETLEALNSLGGGSGIVEKGRKSIMVRGGRGRITRKTTRMSRIGLALQMLGNSLTFDGFARIILFDGLVELQPDEFENVMIMREALVRNSVEHLIIQYSHLKLPDNHYDNPPLWRRMIEPTVGCMIILNALAMGFQADYSDWDGFRVLEGFFTAFFTGEILLKTGMYGCKIYMCGSDWYWNWFDIGVVMLAISDFVLTEMAAGSKSQSLNNITMFRVARLARLTKMMRLLRLLRLRIFRELALMVKGVIAGLRTLFWAIVLLICVAFVLGVLLRQTIGMDKKKMDDEYHTVLFDSVTWSMFYVFRCVTSDCVLPDGSPLVAHLQELYGPIFTIPYVICIIFITFGIFNLIMATFVENVMEAARQKRQLSSEAEAIRVFKKLRTLVLKFGKPQDVKETCTSVYETMSHALSDARGSFNVLDQRASVNRNKKAQIHYQHGAHVSRDTFEEVLEETEVQALFDDLEVHISDRYELFDVIDADCNGTIDVSELIIGILKLRSGGADKSDMVAAILGIRAIQKSVGTIVDLALSQQEIVQAMEVLVTENIVALKPIQDGAA